VTPGRWLLVIVAILIALSTANYIVFHDNTAAINAETKRQLSSGELAKLYRKLIEEVAKAGPHGLVVKNVKLNEGPALRLKQEYRWFIGREVALTVVAIGGVWALYFYDRRKQVSA